MKASRQLSKSFGSAASTLSTVQRKGLKTIIDNRPSAIAQRKLQEAVQAKGVAQLRPMQKEGSTEYHDPDYPLLRLEKGQLSNDYKILGTETIIYYEAGEGWFTDYACNTQANMSNYLGNPNARNGINNNGGTSYYYYENSHNGGFIPTMEAYRLYQEISARLGQNEANFDKRKVTSIVREMENNQPIHPIEVRQGQDGPELTQGRHRIIASMLTGRRAIPYNNV
jgi:hypothetical protein